MELTKSRGYETPSHKHFMRFTVIAADILLLLPAIWYAVTVVYRKEDLESKLNVFVALAAQPGLLLIDHGHFQYNGISLGLAILSTALILDDHDLLGSMAFSLSLNYKQMSLYYAPAFFFVLLAKSVRHPAGVISFTSFSRLFQIGLVVLATFAVCWSPFLLQNDPLAQVSQIFYRIFPVARGLYEDKVANFWCSISPIFKLQNFASSPTMMKICTALTLVSMSPACYTIFNYTWRKDTTKLTQAGAFIIGLACVACSFFFFSFHVHEKSVLLPVFIMSLWINESPNVIIVANVVSTVSMLPLLQRDGHEYSLIFLVFLYIIASKWAFKARVSIALVLASVSAPLAFHFASKWISPPPQLPDIFTLLLTSSSFGILLLCFLHLHLQLYLLDVVQLLEPASKRKNE